jgi:hypothetical protein
MYKQDTVKVVVANGQSIANAKRQIISGRVRQVQVYHNNTDASLFIEATINDASGTPIISTQPVENLRSRDGQYFANMPLDFEGGQNVELEIRLDTPNNSGADLNFVAVFDLDVKTSC